MFDFFWNPNGESGFAKTEDPRLLGNRPTTLGARMLCASGMEPFIP